MATLTPLSQNITDPHRDGLHIVLSKIIISGAADTITLPEGLQSTAHVRILPIDTGDTAPSVTSITQNPHPEGVSVSLAAGGTAGAQMLLITLHAGNQAGL